MSRSPLVPSGLRISAFTSVAAITTLALLCLPGCGGGGNSGGGGSNPIGVSVAASSTTVNGNATVKLTATVSNDSSNAGVAWTTPAVGSLSSTTALVTTYTAPAATASAQSVTLAATSVADKTKSASVTLTINKLALAAVAGNVIYGNANASVCAPPAGPTTTVSINTTPVQSTTTDSNGNFSFVAVPQGTYIVTPSLAGANALFTPATQSVTVGSGSAVASFQAVVGYSVSGTVSYTGAATGPIEVALQPQCTSGGVSYSSGPSLGTTITAPGPFTINGAAPGTYLVKAWRDAAHNNWPNASDPTGSTAVFTVSNADVSSVSVGLADSAAVTFPSNAPYLGAAPFDQGVALSPGIVSDGYNQTPTFWQALFDGQLELATSYTLQWSTDPSFNLNVQSKSFPATGGAGTWVLSGLSNGQPLYFRFQGVAESTTSLWSPNVGPITIGAPAGSITTSGHVTFANAATGPLYIEFTTLTTPRQSYYTSIANPVSPQAYSIQLPAIGNYSAEAYIDQNDDNILYDNGDMLPTGSVYNVDVTGSPASKDFKLTGGGTSFLDAPLTNVQIVDSMGLTEQYDEILAVAWSGSKQLTNMELVSGPNVIVPKDFYRCPWTSAFSFCGYFNLDGNSSNVGDAYGFKFTYSDGSSETVSHTITSLPGSFGANPTPAGIGASLTPTFSWTDPPNAGNYGYTFGINGWEIPAAGWGTFSDSIDSVTWGIDPTGGSDLPSNPSLSSGGNYNWSVGATDSNGNGSALSVGYNPGYTRVTLPDANPATLGAATVGQSYSGTIVATNGSASDAFTVFGLSDGLTSSSNGGTLTISGTPIAAGTITFQVFVIDNTNYWWGPVTYTINVAN
ncbi:MAG: hypothetical protein P4L26_07735 [Terracidiphilus sp.]|nr:hypothetical protein [Terracidiphilus sp.]